MIRTCFRKYSNILLFFAAVFGSNQIGATLGAKMPNIIIIVADDMGFDDVSYRGGREFLTPNIDSLAYHGMILDRLYVPAMCSPSRGAFLTGRFPSHTGTQHFVISNETPWSLPANVTTVAQILQSNGYSTNLVGKWHLGFAKKEFTPTYRGFDYHYGYWGSYIDYYQRRAKMPLKNSSLGFDFRRNMELECDNIGTYVTDLLTAEAERIIMNNNGSQPLFMWVAHLAPHTGNEDEPLQAPVKELDKFKYIKNKERRTYAAMISKLDHSVGQIIRALDRSNMLENSIIMFYSDNGAPSVGQFANTGSNWPFRGQNNTPWEGGVRVGGAIWSPLLANRQSIFRPAVYIGDLLPTLTEAAGIKLDASLNIDGISVWEQLRSRFRDTTSTQDREILHFLDDVWNVSAYMRGKWKYINGTTSNGAVDNVLTYREEYDTDPRDLQYVNAVKSSPASRALFKYDWRRLTKAKIEALRREAAVKCGQHQRACNPLIEECLFDLEEDPCEQNNLAHELALANVLQDMRDQVAKYRRTSRPIGNRPGLPEHDPTHFDCTWTNFLQAAPSDLILDCNSGHHGRPCPV